ncbi:hypothetical protein [Streptomyces sp. CBMA152]|uniref:hypothetical protein n=1 Tax=Streptomyces sp. CBMA152 TaxID=1896312 RepID=UPI0016614957|nr:hypothetical protein [Streptomyces sp. CBMA152]MBD0743824.1 hypothetical protein [Streptomyces sp. CBMA152]
MTGLDWGTVPAWASAFLTSGSLLLGFYILLRDRRKEERQEALKVVCWSEYGYLGTPDQDMHMVHMLNTSSRPVYNASVLVDLRLDAFDGFEGFGLANIIQSTEEATTQIPRRMNDRKIFPAAVSFTDGDGINWVRELGSRRLYRNPHSGRRYLARLRWRVQSAKHYGWRKLFARRGPTRPLRRRLLR